MIRVGDFLILAVLAIVLLIAILAVIRGYKGVKYSKSVDKSNSKMRIGSYIISVLHMSAGILISLCYLIAGAIFLFSFFGE